MLTLSVNLAAGFQQKFPEARVILAELQPGLGDISFQMGYTNPQGLSELLKKKGQDIHRGVVENALVAHKSGLKMLLSSYQPTDVALFSNGEQMTSIVRELARMSQYLVWILAWACTR